MAKSKAERRRGRKRKSLLLRAPSGQLSRSADRRAVEVVVGDRDAGLSLAELRTTRARALGLSDIQAADQKSETIAGRMALRGLLSSAQAMAIDHYARLVRCAAAAMLAPRGTRCSLSPSIGGEGPDDPISYATTMRRYNDAFGAVRDAGPRANRAINIIVRDLCELPASELDYARMGANMLVRHFGFHRARAA